jgi:hypothetical protein
VATSKLEKFFESQGLRPMGTLAHFGIKGMRWGFRKDVPIVGEAALDGPNARLRVLSTSVRQTPSLRQDIRNTTQTVRLSMLKHDSGITNILSGVNKKYATADRNNKAVGKQYHKDLSIELTKFARSKTPSNVDSFVHVDKVAARLYVGTPRVIKSIEKDALKHSEDDELTSIQFDLVLDSDGQVIGFEESKLQHALEEFLAHYGIKGMKWGFRRTDAQLAKARTDISPDAARAQKTLATIKSTKSVSSVSDADLNHLINRINTEKRYAEIATSKEVKPLATTHKGIKIALGAGKTMNAAISFARSPAGRLLASKAGLKKVVDVADKAQALADLGEMGRPKKDS